MNYGELQAYIAAFLHRTDLSGQIPDFVENARERLNRRFNLVLVPLVDDTDTNDLLTATPSLYYYAAISNGYGFLHNGEAMTTYNTRWEDECDRQNILQPFGPADNFTAPPIITIYEAP